MGNRVVLVTWLMLTVWCWSKAQKVKITTISSNKTLSWERTQNYCRRSFTSMVTGPSASSLSLSRFLRRLNKIHIWVGLRRNAVNDSQWNWINQTEDVSGSIRWDSHHSSPYCALVKTKQSQQRWFSVRCSIRHEFFCSEGTKVIFYSSKHSWFEAEEFCQEKGGHLVTVTRNNTGDLKRKGWIGLYRVGGDTWHWVGKQHSTYRTWADGEPSTADCGALNVVENMYQSRCCSDALSAICKKDNLVLVKLNRTWEEAQEFCTLLNCTWPKLCKFNLLVVKNTHTHHYVRERIHEATTDEVWVGQRFLAGRWYWGIYNQLEEPVGASQCPAHHCGVISKSDPSISLNRACNEKRNFICTQTETPEGPGNH